MLDKNTLIYDIHELKELKCKLEEVLDNIKSSISAIDSKMQSKENLLLQLMKEYGNDVDESAENLVAAIFKRENIGYTDESAVLEYLKLNNKDDLIRVKTTEALDKIAIKKALKIDPELAENLEAMITRSVTEYVVVTTKENYSKMLEHANSGTKN